MNNIQKFSQVLNEGISQERLADILCYRLESRYPDIYNKYDYDKVYNVVDDVASFHAGAEELGSSDISIMLRQVIKNLESSQGVEEGRVQQIPTRGADYSKYDTDHLKMMLRPGILHRDEARFKALIRKELQKREQQGQQGVAEAKPSGESTLWRVEQSAATGRYHIVKGYQQRKVWKNSFGSGDFNSKDAAQKKADELNGNVTEEQLDELNCWTGYKRVPGTKAGSPGSCEKINELSTEKLKQYKTAAAADARKADSEGDYERGNKRFAGIVKATKKQFDNETKPKKESAIMKGIQNETLGLPYPGTYEQENDPFKRKGQERTMKIAFEGKKNVGRRT